MLTTYRTLGTTAAALAHAVKKFFGTKKVTVTLTRRRWRASTTAVGDEYVKFIRE